jgi:xylose isomerase
MNGENLAEYAALLASEGLLGHQHSNSGWGTFDDDNMTDAAFFMQTLELAKILQLVGYGQNGERIGFDLFPYTEDQVQAVKRSILQWEFLWDLASKIDTEALRAAWKAKDAVKGQEVVYKALGLDESYIKRIATERSGSLK